MTPKDPLPPPRTLEAIIERLEVTYPLAGYRNLRSEREFDRYQGAQDVIEHLRSLLKDEEDGLPSAIS